MPQSLTMLAGFFPPDLSPAYLAALAGPLGESLLLVLASMTLAVMASLPLATMAALRLPGTRALVAVLSLLRAVPDLTLAIFCVILFGIGPGAGMMALAIYYTAALARMFTDLLDTAATTPLDALRATGARRWQVALFGLLPLAAPALRSYGAFAVECALRSSIIVGAVGAGGIGTELTGTLAAYDFHRAGTVILLLVGVIALLDRLAEALRERPHLLLALIPCGLAATWLEAPQIVALGHGLAVARDMLPPMLDGEALAALPGLISQTLVMALAGTLGAALAGLVVALAASRRRLTMTASRRLAPAWLAFAARRLLELLRTVPETVWALVLVATAGIGPVSGAWALGLHSLGCLGRLFADVLDDAPAPPREALAATGARPLAITAWATLPLSAGPMAAHVLFRLDWNLRMATVLGLIGAGGIGQALYQAQQLFFYRQVLAYVLATAALILLVDWLSAALRWRLAQRIGTHAAARSSAPSATSSTAAGCGAVCT